MIRVVIAEDQSMVLGALAALLDIERDIEVVGRARNGREALDLVRRVTSWRRASATSASARAWSF
jgi:two-component system, NarL family, response regulator DesR